MVPYGTVPVPYGTAYRTVRYRKALGMVHTCVKRTTQMSDSLTIFMSSASQTDLSRLSRDALQGHVWCHAKSDEVYKSLLSQLTGRSCYSTHGYHIRPALTSFTSNAVATQECASFIPFAWLLYDGHSIIAGRRREERPRVRRKKPTNRHAPYEVLPSADDK